MAVVPHTKVILVILAMQLKRYPVRLIAYFLSYKITDRLLSLLLIVAIDRFRKETYRVYGVLEIRLSGRYATNSRDYLAGKDRGRFSIADIGAWTWVKLWRARGFSDEEMEAFPHLLNWIDRIAKRPAVKRGTGNKYSKT
jgi:glutathione S-transferase